MGDLQSEFIQHLQEEVEQKRAAAADRLREVEERFPELDAIQHPHDYNQVCVSTRSILAQNDTCWKLEAKRLRGILTMMRDNADAAGGGYRVFGSGGATMLAANMKEVCERALAGEDRLDIENHDV